MASVVARHRNKLECLGEDKTKERKKINDLLQKAEKGVKILHKF